MITVLAANNFGDNLGDGVAGPIGLLIIVLLVIATVFLMRSMNKHLKRVPEKFDGGAPSGAGEPAGTDENARVDAGAESRRQPTHDGRPSGDAS